MINRTQGPKMQVCKKHTRPIIAYQQAQPFCQTCLVEQSGAVPVDLFSQKLEEILLKQNQTNQEQHQLLYSLQDNLVNYKYEINNQLDKIIQVIKEQIKLIDTPSQSFQMMIDQIQNQQKLTSELEKELDNQQTSYKSVRSLIEKLLQAFYQKFSNINSTFDIFKQNQVLDKQDITKKINIVEINVDKYIYNDKYQYELLEQSTKKEDSFCQAFAFTKDNSVVAVACAQQIIIYEFINGQLKKELQRLNCHKFYMFCLYFMKQSSCLVVSGNGNGLIIIWDLDKNNQYFVQQKLMKHKDYVLCILINKKEDLLISGSMDKTIIFWRLQNGSWQCNQIINMDCKIFALSLNESENKLVSCGSISQISIMEYQQNDQQWIIVQTIDVNECGYRLRFTIGNQFVFQPTQMNDLEIYDYDQINKKFLKLSQVEVQCCDQCNCLSPCQYIKQLNILTVKHGEFLNIFQVNQDGDYKIIQTIKYEEQQSSYGCLSNDGQYLVTWDSISKEIQVRELRQIK